jgi:iduronate 2-sulfatase
MTFHSAAAAVVTLLQALAVCAISVATTPSALPSASGQKLNVVFMVSDDMRPELGGPYGLAGMHTPNFIRLANESTTFLRAYTQVRHRGLHFPWCKQ